MRCGSPRLTNQRSQRSRSSVSSIDPAWPVGRADAGIWQAAGVGTIRVQREGPVGFLVIDNEERRNAMDRAMYAAVPAAAAELRRDPALRVVVLRGAGDEAFGAGSDISEFPEHRFGDSAADYDRLEHDAWAALTELEVPVIAAINGPCMGGGVAMALHADIRVAADDARFALPPARLGIAYPVTAVGRLVALVGPGRANLLLASARVIDADTAERYGLVDEVVERAELHDHVGALAGEIAALAPLSIRAAKAAISSLVPTVAAESHATAAVTACYDSEDFHEGVAAFMEKRPAEFRGR